MTHGGQSSASESARHTLRGTFMASLRTPQYTRPFTSWEEMRQQNPDHLEVRRFSALASQQQPALWRSRRAHSPCDIPVPRDWDLDALYFRCPEEEAYGRRIRKLSVSFSNTPRLSVALLCFGFPVVPYNWPLPQTPCPATYTNFTPRGDLPDPAGGETALDSAWSLREGSIADGSGDPGRMLGEARKEARDTHRKFNEFVAYHQVEFYRQGPPARQSLYPRIPSWWEEVWVSQNMFVPLPPVITYRARSLLPEKVGTPEGEFFERVLEAEWTALVFGRWCADIPQRGIMWALSPRLRRNIDEMGVPALRDQSRYSRADVEKWLADHDSHPWLNTTMLYRERGPRNQEPEHWEELCEFVRPYPGYRVTLRISPKSKRWSVPHEPTAIADIPIPTLDQPSVEARSPLGPNDSPPLRAELPARPHLRSVPLTVANPSSLADPLSASAGGMADPATFAGTKYAESEAVPDSLTRKLRLAGLEGCIQHYARRDLLMEYTGSVVPVREEAIVNCIFALERHRQTAAEEISGCRRSLEEAEERVARAEQRARRSEARADLLTDAYVNAMEGQATPGKRRREE
jgi:hypothetical protein